MAVPLTRQQTDPGADPSASIPPLPAELTGPQTYPVAATDGPVAEVFGPSFPGQADVAPAASRFRSPEGIADVDRRDIEFEGGHRAASVPSCTPPITSRSASELASRSVRFEVFD